MAEIDKLISYLEEHGYKFTQGPCCFGRQIVVYSGDIDIFDVVCHPYSYGGEEGLLEVMERTENNYILTEDERNRDDVLGYLTAKDVIKRLEKSEVPHE